MQFALQNCYKLYQTTVCALFQTQSNKVYSCDQPLAPFISLLIPGYRKMGAHFIQAPIEAGVFFTCQGAAISIVY